VEELEPVKTQKKGLLKKIGKAVAWLCGLMLFGLGLLLALLFIYEDEVKAAVIAELNRHLKAEVRIDPKDMDLTIIRSFPDCSMEFKNVLMLEALPLKQRDTLLFARTISLHFNMKDLWNKRYHIHKIKVNEALIKLRVLKDGRVNYVFWDDNPSAENKNSNLAFELESLRLEQCRLIYSNRPSAFKSDVTIRNLDLGGKFSQANFELDTRGALVIHELTQKGQVFLKEKDCDFSVELDVSGIHYRIRKAGIRLNQLELELGGNFTYDKLLSRLQLNYQAPRLDIASALSLLPGKFKTTFADYESSGNFYARGKLDYNSEKDFRLQTEFGIRNGTITYKPGGMTARQVQLEGRLDYAPGGSVLSFKHIGLNLNNDVVQGSCHVKDLKDPYLDLQLQASLHLENLKAFLPLDTLTRLKGDLKLNTTITGLLRDLKSQTFSNKVRVDLEAQINGLEAQFKGDEQVIAIARGSVQAKDREVEVKDLELKRGSSDLKLNARLPGFFNYLAGAGQPLVIRGNLYADYIRLEDFMVKYKASGGEGPLIPAHVSFQFHAAILKFSYSKFEARAITGEIEIRNQKAMVSDMKLETMEGDATIDAFADNSNNRLEVTLQSRLKNINISRLFYQFNNFGQATLQDKHLKGYASADIDFSGRWNNRLEVDENSLRADARLNIERGELVDFKPLLSLSRFVDIQDLQHIKFSSLQGDVHIANKTISLPKTVIKNSALNIDFWGSHGFDNVIDYHLQLVISELMAKKRKKPQDEFGPVENDPDKKRSAFIRMTGTVDDPDIKYLDLKGMKQKIREDIRQENKTVKSILKEEFGLFKKDTSLKKPNKPAPAFELEKPGNNSPKKALEPKKKEEDEDF
jgi:hypothetical protein